MGQPLTFDVQILIKTGLKVVAMEGVSNREAELQQAASATIAGMPVV